MEGLPQQPRGGDGDTQIVPFPAISQTFLNEFLMDSIHPGLHSCPWTPPELLWNYFFFFLLLLQVTAAPQPGAAIAAWPTIPTSTSLGATIPTMMSLEGQKTRITPSSESSGGTTLPQTPGTRWAPKATCPGNWPPCHVRMEMQLLVCQLLQLF